MGAAVGYAVNKRSFANRFIDGLPRAGGYSVPNNFARRAGESWSDHLTRVSSGYESAACSATEGTFCIDALLEDVKQRGIDAIAESKFLVLLPAVCSVDLRGAPGDELSWHVLVNQTPLVAVVTSDIRENFATACSATDLAAIRVQESIRQLRGRHFAVFGVALGTSGTNLSNIFHCSAHCTSRAVEGLTRLDDTA